MLSLWKVAGLFLRKLSIYLSDDPEIPPVSIYSREMKTTIRKPVCELMMDLSVVDKK